jgi:hypothetical protein
MQNTTLDFHSVVVFKVTHNTSLNKRHLKKKDLPYKNSPWQRVFTDKIMPPTPVNITIMLVISPHNNQFPNVKREFDELKRIWNLKIYINIISDTKIRRMEWLGKAVRMEDFGLRLQKKIYFQCKARKRAKNW